MNSLKCPQCGLVNFATSETCKRCGTLLQAGYDDAPQYDHQNQYSPNGEKPAFFSGAVVVLTAILIVGAVLCIVQQVAHPFDAEAARGIGGLVGLIGVFLLFIAHIWLLIRIFEQSIGWGFASLVIPFAIFAAVAQFWEKTRRSFVGQLICVGIMLVGIGIGL